MSLTTRVSALLTILSAMIFSTLPAARAADLSELSVDQQIEMVRSLNEAARQATVAANLDLSRETGDAFWPVYRSYRGEVAAINDSLKSVVVQYAEEYATLTDEQAYSLAAQALKIQIQRDKLKQKYLKRFAKVLPKLTAARVLQIENKLDALALAELALDIPLIQAR